MEDSQRVWSLVGQPAQVGGSTRESVFLKTKGNNNKILRKQGQIEEELGV